MSLFARLVVLATLAFSASASADRIDDILQKNEGAAGIRTFYGKISGSTDLKRVGSTCSLTVLRDNRYEHRIEIEWTPPYDNDAGQVYTFYKHSLEDGPANSDFVQIIPAHRDLSVKNIQVNYRSQSSDDSLNDIFVNAWVFEKDGVNWKCAFRK